MIYTIIFTIVFFWALLKVFVWLLNFPDPHFKKIHHIDRDDFDLEFTDWKPVNNPRYAGNIFQSTWWWEGNRKIIRNAKKFLERKEKILR